MNRISSEAFKPKDTEKIERQLKEISEKVSQYTDIQFEHYPLGYIGSGLMGVVCLTLDNRILKITTDRNEANASNSLVGVDSKYVLKVFQVFQFKSMEGLYFILEERLLPLTSKEKDVASDVMIEADHINRLQKRYFGYERFDYNNYKELAEAIEKTNIGPKEEIQMKLERLKELWPIIEHYDLAAVGRIISAAIYATADHFLQTYTKENVPMVNDLVAGLRAMLEQGVNFKDTHEDNIAKTADGIYKWIDLGGPTRTKGRKRIEVKEARFITEGSNLENVLIEKLFKKYQEKLKDTEWKVKMDPSRKGILFGIKKEDMFLVYEIFLMCGQFLILMRKPQEKLLGRVQNNFRANHLARELFVPIWEDSRQEKQQFFNHEEYPYANGPLDNRRFKRGGWMDNCVLFSKRDQGKRSKGSTAKIKINRRSGK